MATPIPGVPVRGSTSGQPLMALFDLLGRRWAMRILWEVNAKPSSFRELQACCGNMSSSVLNTRIKELREAGLIMLADEGYRITACGNELMSLLSPLREWSKNWEHSLEA
ncbi:helix-turn-helix transcriptional regulator [Burkholderiaceae bacterium DAT-1]|nr:helix-turn-helix transcriptional regulator [Burkholderiaceae bacterium DAT-1]